MSSDHVERLAHEVDRPAVQGLHTCADVGHRRQHDDRGRVLAAPKGAEQLETTDLRHDQVQQHEIDVLAVEDFERRPAVAGRQDLVPFTAQTARQEGQDAFLVVDSQDL